MTRIIVHAGFHKTGTTNLQSFLSANRARLKPHASIYMGHQLGEARRLGRIYGERPVIWRRWLFRRALRRFLATLPDAPVILISRESFAGAIPGATRLGRPVTRYAPMAVPLAREIVAGCHRRFGANAQVELLYTTRARDGFLRSVWGHQLRTKRLTEDLASFTAHFPADLDLAAEIATAVAPVTVHTATLEDVAGVPLGPGRLLLDLLGVSQAERAGFAPPDDHHTGPSAALRDRFLRMNRSRPKGKALRQEKERLWREESQAREH
ncbi:MAG: hypothetical protein GY717_08255 [Rhodobacteraceae bacterium]|nr:hypothetical protein [Paracoccaceae bacterium]